MTTRTFKQQGQAYGTTPATVVAKIDGVEVFNGTVSALDRLPPFMPIPADGYPLEVQDLFSWTDDVNFAGTKTMEVSVIAGTLLLTESVANYIKIVNEENPPPGVTSGSSVFGKFYRTVVDDVVWVDPMSNVVIGGIPQTVARELALPGQYYWLISAETTFTSTITIQPGYETNPVFPPAPGV